jgi:hypothetical protein
MMSKHDLPGETREGLTAFESRFRREEGERKGGGIPVGGWGWSSNRRRGGGIYTPEDQGRWIKTLRTRVTERVGENMRFRHRTEKYNVP